MKTSGNKVQTGRAMITAIVLAVAAIVALTAMVVQPVVVNAEYVDATDSPGLNGQNEIEGYLDYLRGLYIEDGVPNSLELLGYSNKVLPMTTYDPRVERFDDALDRAYWHLKQMNHIGTDLDAVMLDIPKLVERHPEAGSFIIGVNGDGGNDYGLAHEDVGVVEDALRWIARSSKIQRITFRGVKPELQQALRKRYAIIANKIDIVDESEVLAGRHDDAWRRNRVGR